METATDTDDLNSAANALHYTREGYEILGRRFAEKAVELLTRKSVDAGRDSTPLPLDITSQCRGSELL